MFPRDFFWWMMPTNGSGVNWSHRWWQWQCLQVIPDLGGQIEMNFTQLNKTRRCDSRFMTGFIAGFVTGFLMGLMTGFMTEFVTGFSSFKQLYRLFLANAIVSKRRFEDIYIKYRGWLLYLLSQRSYNCSLTIHSGSNPWLIFIGDL